MYINWLLSLPVQTYHDPSLWHGVSRWFSQGSPVSSTINMRLVRNEEFWLSSPFLLVFNRRSDDNKYSINQTYSFLSRGTNIEPIQIYLMLWVYLDLLKLVLLLQPDSILEMFCNAPTLQYGQEQYMIYCSWYGQHFIDVSLEFGCWQPPSPWPINRLHRHPACIGPYH